MGMFDTFMGIVECPHCNQKTKVEHQFKWGDCTLTNYYVGDIIPGTNIEDSFVEENYHDEACVHCKQAFNTGIIIHNGQFIMMDVLEKVKDVFDKADDMLNEDHQLHHVHPLQGKMDFREYEIQNAKLKQD